jgi:hypothetical protein
MSKIEIALSSPAFWSFVGVIVVQILTALLPNLQGNIAIAAQVILSVLALYLHPKEIQVAGATGMLGSKSIRK